MGYINKTSMLQNSSEDIEKVFVEGGWDNFLKYRVYNGTGPTEKFGEVRLFKSLGSDNILRYLGMVVGYDTGVNQFNDNRFIFQDSNLGLMGIGDGIETTFQAKVFPMDNKDHIYVYQNGTAMPDGSYTLDETRGLVIFKEAPSDGTVVSATYHLASTAPEPATRLVFFTFNAVYLEKLKIQGSPSSKVGDGDGTTTVFRTPTAPIKINTLRVYVDTVLIDSSKYSANLSTGEITFNEAPSLGSEITVEYTEIVGGSTLVKAGVGDGINDSFYTPSSPVAEGSLKVYVNSIPQVVDTDYTADLQSGKITFKPGKIPKLGHEITIDYTSLSGGAPPPGSQTKIGDVKVEGTFDPLDTTSLMSAVYSSLVYLNPSLPTALSFTPDKLFERSLQRDSLIHYWGQINKDRIAIFFRPDPSGGPDKTYFAPLYAGRLLTQGEWPKRNMVLIGGCRPEDEITWSKDKMLGVNLVDYGEDTSNGNSFVNLQQTLGGSYYQKHYLAFITHDIDVDNGDGKFNPSSYTNMYHFSRMFIVHPNDGYVGELDDIYAVHPKSIYQMDELEIKDTVKDEHIGSGNSINKIFHARRTPKDGTITVKVGCNELLPADFTLDRETKAITLKVPPTVGEDVLVSYTFEQIYQYTLPTTPRTPFRLKEASPYAPIGIAILKENK